MPSLPVSQPAAFVGWWDVVRYVHDGEETDVSGIIEHVDDAGSFTVFRDGVRIASGRHVEFTVNPLGFTNVRDASAPDGRTRRELAIYRLGDDVLEVCKASEDTGRPARFGSARGSAWTHVLLRRRSTESPRRYESEV